MQYLQILTPAAAHVASPTTAHATSPATSPYHYPTPPASAHSYPSAALSSAEVLDRCEGENSHVLTYFPIADHEQWPAEVPGDVVSLAREGVVGDGGWLSDAAKSALYKWIGRHSTEWYWDTERLPSVPASGRAGAMSYRLAEGGDPPPRLRHHHQYQPRHARLQRTLTPRTHA